MADERFHLRPDDPVKSEPEPDDDQGWDAATGGELDRTRRLNSAAGGEPDRDPVAARPAVWSGRAGVPSPSPVRYSAPTEWSEVDDRYNGRWWWMPILVGVVVLLLLGMLALGVWLIVAAREDGTVPVDPPSVTAAPTSPVQRTSTAAPTAGRSTASVGPSPTAPVAVLMPTLVGLPVGTASRVLDQLGLDYRIQERPSDRPVGTVLATDPRAGTPVEFGDQVTLVVAAVPVDPPTIGSESPGSIRATR